MNDEFDDDLIDDDIREETEGDRDADESEANATRQLNEAAGDAIDFCAEVADELREVEWARLTVAGLYGILLLPMLVFAPLARASPASWRVYHKINKWSAWQMQKAASADAVANVRKKNDKEDLLPAKMVESSKTDGERDGWKVKGISGKRYDPSVRGGTSSRYGKADMIHINEDDPEQGTWVEATMDAAIQTDRERYLFRDATIRDTKRGIPVDGSLGNAGMPVADGGVNPAAGGDSDLYFNVQERQISIESPGIHEDTLIPLSSLPGYDGTVVSFSQYSNLKNEQADQQKIADAKNAGRMAALMEQLDKKDLFKWALILSAAGAVLLFHQDIGAAIASFGGGGGGGGNVAPTGGLGFLPALAYRLRGE